MARTLIDLGSVTSPDKVERALQDALRQRLTTIERLLIALKQEGGRGRRGAATLRRLLKDVVTKAPTESELERRVLRILVDAGLPLPVCQHPIELQSGLLVRIDFAYPEAKLAIEADGYRWHSAPTDWSRDRTRLNAIVARGWRVLHTTWTDIECGGTELVQNVRSILGQQSLL